PSIAFWIRESLRLSDARPANVHGALFCADTALKLATNRLDWANAEYARGVALLRLGDLTSSIGSFEGIEKWFSNPLGIDERVLLARTLVSKGVALGQLERSDEELAAYDEVVKKFGSAREELLRHQVARALFNKGVVLNDTGQRENAIAVYDDVVK